MYGYNNVLRFYARSIHESSGKRKLPFWENVERSLKPTAKLDLVLHHVGHTVDKSKRPFQTFKDIFDFRNALVHGKPQTVRFSGKRKLKKGERTTRPLANWESFSNLRNATRCLKDTEEMILILEKLCLGVSTLETYAIYGNHSMKKEGY